MPELPEVEIVKRSLEFKIQNRKIVSIEVGFDKLIKRQSPSTFLERMNGLTFSSLERRGKYLLFRGVQKTETITMINHLGMTGAWFAVEKPDQVIDKYRNHRHILFLLDDGTLLIYCDIRKFGEMTAFTESEFRSFKPIQEMGPEPFSENAQSLFLANIRQKKWENKPIKSVMLEQRVLAGVGNIYINEALHLLSIHPNTLVSKLSNETLSELFFSLKDLFSLSIQMGGSSFSDYVDSEGNRGSFQTTFRVYKMKNCRTCGEGIIRTEIAKRSTFHCPVCQKEKK